MYVRLSILDQNILRTFFFFFGFAPESGAAQPGFGGSTATNEDSEKQTSGCIAYKLVYANYGKETETN